MGGKASDLTRSDMRQDVDQSSEWIPHVKPPDAPRLSRRTGLDLESRSHRSLVNLADVVDLDRDVRYGSTRRALGRDADLPPSHRHRGGTSYSGDGVVDAAAVGLELQGLPRQRCGLTVIGRRGAPWLTSSSIGRRFRDAASSFASRWKMQGPIILMWHVGWRAKDAAFRRCWP